MSVQLKIVQAGERVLRQESKPLTVEETRSRYVQDLIELMRETMRGAPGVGLAAPQVGLPIQLAVIEDRAELLKALLPERLAERARRPVPFQVIVNPQIRLGSSTATFFEGCLSVSGYSALVPRAFSVEVDCLNERGEEVTIRTEGWHARILQHEIDHLHGTLYVDRMISRSLVTAEHYTRYWNEVPLDRLRDEFGFADLSD